MCIYKLETSLIMRYSILLLLLCSFCYSYGQKIPAFPYNSWINVQIPDDLHGSVKSIKIKRIHYRDDTVINNSYDLSQDFKFSANKKLKEIRFTNNNGELMRLYHYDKYGRITNIEQFRSDTVLRTFKYIYNELTKVSSELVYEGNSNLLEETVITYNNNNHPVRREMLRKGTLLSYQLYNYDKFNNLNQEIFVNTPNGFGITIDKSITGTESEFTPYPNDTATIKYEYTPRRKIKTKTIFQYGTLNSIEKNWTDRDTLISEKAEYRRGAVTSKTIIKTIKDLKITERQHLFGNPSIFKFYSINGKDVKSEQFENSKKISEDNYTYNYEFDAEKNWIKCESFSNGKITSVILREIEYY